MSQDLLIKGFVVLIMSLVFAGTIFFRYDDESRMKSSEGNQQKYLPYISGNLLLSCILTVAIFGVFMFGVQETTKLIISVCFGVFVHTSLYYIALIVTIPLFRKYMSARTCAVLWMLPNYLYITLYSGMEVNAPLVVFHASQNVVRLIFYIWLTGFLAVLLGNIVLHLVFRSNILKNAKDVTNIEILEIWNEKLETANMRYKKYRLIVSPNAKTPLSVGLFRRKTCVVLPDKEYSLEELRLIFQHEIVHIGREDSWSKFFLLFCTAMCWFNPLMWIAMRKSADDLELSCDETVLLDVDDEDRRRYAELILSTAGDERGFTTCLSASASAMRYRLKNIIKTKTRRSGILVVGVIFFILVMSYGYVALAYGESSTKELIQYWGEAEKFQVEQMYLSTPGQENTIRLECEDKEAFYRYMDDLMAENLTGKYSFSDDRKMLSFICNTSKVRMYIQLSDDIIRILPTDGTKRAEWHSYYLPEGVDWLYLESILIPITTSY